MPNPSDGMGFTRKSLKSHINGLKSNVMAIQYQ
jgi:hypothetical protein